MKKTSLIIALFALLFSTSNTGHAQSVPVANKLPHVDLGIKLGANFAKITGTGWEQGYQPGVVGGATIGLRKHKVGLQVEFLLSTAHYSTASLMDSIHKGEFRSTYFDIPVMLEYRVLGGKMLPKFWLMGGVQFSNLLSIKSTNEFAGDVKSTFTSSNMLAVLGLEMRYLKFTLGGRYIAGISEMNAQAASEAWKSTYSQVYLGYRFL